jgi:cytochrome c5
MKKVFLFLAMFAVSAMIMVSCGGNGDNAATDNEATTDQTAVDEGEATPVDEAAPATDEATTDEATTDEAATDEGEGVTLGDAAHGKEIYDASCMACHATGAAGAAKLDDKARWEATAAQGLATVYDHAINGFTGEHGPMPAKGGNANLSDQDIHDAVAYMFKEAGVEVK